MKNMRKKKLSQELKDKMFQVFCLWKLIGSNKYKVMEKKYRDYQQRAASMSDNYYVESGKSSEVCFWNAGKGKYADFRNEEMLKERARQFIAKIHHYKARSDGEYLVKKRQAQQRRDRREKLESEAKLKERQLRVWQKRSKILEKIYAKELEREQKFAASVLKQRQMSTKNPVAKKQNSLKQIDKPTKIQKDKKPDLSKRYKTVPDAQTSLSLPRIQSSKLQAESVDFKMKYRIDSKKEKMLYLSNKDRVTISQIHEKIGQLNRIASNTRVPTS